MSAARAAYGGRLVAPAVLLAAALVASAFPARFALEREAVLQGEVWRLWTGHLVHASGAHFALDVGVALVLLPLVAAPAGLLVLPPLVGVGVLAVVPDVEVYCGLSGVLHGWIVLASWKLARVERGGRALLAGAVLAATLAKATLETVLGAPLLTGGLDLGGAPVVAAHFLGAASGCGLSGWPASSIHFLPDSLGIRGPARPGVESSALRPVAGSRVVPPEKDPHHVRPRW